MGRRKWRDLTEVKHRQDLTISKSSSVLYFLAVLCGLPVSELLSIFFVYKGIFLLFDSHAFACKTLSVGRN